MNWFSTFLDIGTSLYNSASTFAMQSYMIDTMSKMGQLRVDALNQSADALIEQAEMQAKEYELERQASQIQSIQQLQARVSEYNDALEFNNFMTEARLGGGESMSVARFVDAQSKIVTRDLERLDTQASLVDSSLRIRGRLSMLNGITAARAQRTKAMESAYQNTIDMLKVYGSPFDTAKDVISDFKTVGTTIYEHLT
tara:strand:+ start:618 stop:1211 length:594 start_codon:yes stop_codon:yes gene_type:complete